MEPKSFVVRGHPATFATRREVEWKESLASQVPGLSMDGREKGVGLRFILPTLTPAGHPLDVDNLCEPVFTVLVRKAGWFAGGKTNIQWWWASKEVGAEHGCEITVYSDSAPDIPEGPPDWDQTYTGVLPSCATSPEVALWAWQLRSERGIDWTPDTCSLFLGFSSPKVNLGDISTGVVKAFIDCLYPWIGGTAGAPDDHRISRLIVQKGAHGLSHDSVNVKLWASGRITQPLLPGQRRESVRRMKLKPKTADGCHYGAISNPYRPGTGKWTV